jgi:hypothetical protein
MFSSRSTADSLTIAVSARHWICSSPPAVIQNAWGAKWIDQCGSTLAIVAFTTAAKLARSRCSCLLALIVSL